MKFCPKCGTKRVKNCLFCPTCGNAIPSLDNITTTRDDYNASTAVVSKKTHSNLLAISNLFFDICLAIYICLAFLALVFPEIYLYTSGGKDRVRFLPHTAILIVATAEAFLILVSGITSFVFSFKENEDVFKKTGGIYRLITAILVSCVALISVFSLV